MKRLKQLGIVALIAMNAWFVMGQTETFPRWRLVGGTGGVPVEVGSSGNMLNTLTGSAAAADTGLAATLPRFRLAGGLTGNLAEVDSTGHLLVTGTTAGVTSITGTASQVVADVSTGAVTLSLPQSIATTSTPQFAGLGLGNVSAASGLISTSALNHCLAIGPNGSTTPMLDINCSVASAANGILITPTASGSGVTVSAQGGVAENLTLGSGGTGRVVVATNGTGRAFVYNTEKWTVTPTATQTIAAGNTITVNSCGTVKMITAAGAVTTDTTNTFTATTSSNNGCMMWVCNVGVTNTITLDHNAAFFSLSGADVPLLANSCIAVVNDGTVWRQMTPVMVAS